MQDLVPVRARDCACPGFPHKEDGDIVYLRRTLPIEGGIHAERQMADVGDPVNDPDGTVAIRKLEMLWARTFIEYGAVSWNLVDGEGQSIPFDHAVITEDWAFAREVADKASDLYGDSVISPFMKASGSKSRDGQTATSTSRRRTSRAKRAEQSSRATTEASPPSMP